MRLGKRHSKHGQPQSAVTRSGMVAAFVPVLELRNLTRAALFGARMVILDAEPSAGLEEAAFREG